MRTTIAAIIIAIAVIGAAGASVPPVINYQGKLMQPSGAPVPDGAYQMTFAMYDVPTGGTALWSETNPSVQVKGGLFSVLLGSVVNLPANIFDSPNRWFGVKVGDDPEMTPRQQIASVGYAIRAGSADVATTVSDGAITTDKLADGAVTTSKLADGAVTAANIADAEVTAPKIANGVLPPPGSIVMFGGITAPSGWLLCDGSAVSRTVYRDLFFAIGTSYGSGDGVATFNLPDLTGKVPVGAKSGDADFGALGRTGGTKTVNLNHNHSISDQPWVERSCSGFNGNTAIYVTGYGRILQGNIGGNDAGCLVTNNTASSLSTAQSVLQPYQTVNFIIKY